ncbi:dienelactone hydrolase family protein [Pseudomonas shirazica]|nr:dienelactone hydrolase family protein [Pseudomonas shirazica]
MRYMEMTGFMSFLFSDGEYEHLVYTKGEGKPVLIMHELPGLTSDTRNFAERLIDAGFQVYLPLLFGKLEEKGSVPKGYILCMTKEFGFLKAGTSAPVSDWLRALVRHLGASMRNAKIGVIGMCVTGAFAIPLILETNVGAAVASQPAVPFKFGYWIIGKGDGPWMSQLNISDDDLLMAGQASANQRTPLLIQRFADDRLCPTRGCRGFKQTSPIRALSTSTMLLQTAGKSTMPCSRRNMTRRTSPMLTIPRGLLCSGWSPSSILTCEIVMR